MKKHILCDTFISWQELGEDNGDAECTSCKSKNKLEI